MNMIRFQEKKHYLHELQMMQRDNGRRVDF